MAKSNYGKEWEDHFEKDWKTSFPKRLILRLKDDTSHYFGASKNPCDYVCHVGTKVFMIECKCCYGNTFNFHKLSQYDLLITYKDVIGVKAGVMLWFIDHDTVMFVPIETIEQMKNDDCKSININKLDKYKDTIVYIPSTKLRVFMRCDYSIMKELYCESKD